MKIKPAKSIPLWIPIRRCGCRIVDRGGEDCLCLGSDCELHPPLTPATLDRHRYGWDELDPDEDVHRACPSCGGSGERAIGIGWSKWVLVAPCKICRAEVLRAAHAAWAAAAPIYQEIA